MVKNHQDDDGRDHPQQLAVVFKAAGEIVRQRQGVVVGFGMHAQPSCHQLPVQVSADGQADGDPAFGDAGEEDGARQAHQQPAAHVGSAGGQRGHHAAQTAAAENIVIKVVGCPVGKQADQHHPENVHQEGHQHRCAHCHLILHFHYYSRFAPATPAPVNPRAMHFTGRRAGTWRSLRASAGKIVSARNC